MECIVYAKQRFNKLTGGKVPWKGNHMTSIELWNDVSAIAKHGNIIAPSIAVWDDGTTGHSAVIEKMENGKVYMTEANFARDGKITSTTFTDIYQIRVHCGSRYTFKGYIK